MKKSVLGVMAAAVLLLSWQMVQAANYSQMSTAELAAMRGTIQSATQEEQQAFQEEWQRRVRKMTSAERRQYLGPPAETPAGTMPGLQGQEQRRDELPSAWAPGRAMEGGRLPGVQRGRERLLVPPASMAPRRFGQEEWQEPLQERGPRPFAPAPDFDGAPPPFDLDRRPAEEPRGRGR